MDSYRRDRRQYDRLVTDASSAADSARYETALDIAYVASSFARRNALRWYDERLESTLETVGESLVDDSLTLADGSSDTIDIVYLASFLRDYGGHSEQLRFVIEACAGAERVGDQSLVLTYVDNEHTEFPRIRDNIEPHCDIVELDADAAYRDRVVKLAHTLADIAPDRIVLFINPADVVSVAALSGVSDPPRTIFYNHADNQFWLGRNVFDEMVEYRSLGRTLSKQYRDLDPGHIIPITTDIEPAESRTSPLDILGAKTVSLSVGSAEKVSPDGRLNYYRTIDELLSEQPSHYHVLVTDDRDAARSERDRYCSVVDRFLIDGPFADLSPIYADADVLIETFPYGGGVVRMEAMACGLPIASFRNGRFPFICETDTFPEAYAYRTTDADELVGITAELIADERERKRVGDRLAAWFDRNFSPTIVGTQWRELLVDGRMPRNDHVRDVGTVSVDPAEYSRYVRDDIPVYKHLLYQTDKKKTDFHPLSKYRYFSRTLLDRGFDSHHDFLHCAESLPGVSSCVRGALAVGRTLR